MPDFICLRALIHHLQADKGDPASLIHLVALGAQSAELLHRFKASGEPLGTLPPYPLQCELRRYAEQRFSVLVQSAQQCLFFQAARQWLLPGSRWETPLGIPLLEICPDLPLLLYYLDVAEPLRNHSVTAIEPRWQHHLHRTVSFMAMQMLVESGLWDAIYVSRDGVMALDHQTKKRLLLSEVPLDSHSWGYAREWRQLSLHSILHEIADYR